MPVVKYLLILLTALLLGVTGNLYSQTTWTGSVNTAWHTAGNWTAGVPDASDDVTIPDVINDPVISGAGAVARSVTIQSGGLLTLQAAGSLAINGSLSQGIYNGGTVQNSGTILIGNTSMVTASGIVNNHIFINQTGSTVQIDRIAGGKWENVPIDNNPGGQFRNIGTIRIGASAASGQYGLNNSGQFSNDAGGIIHIDRITGYAIRNNNAFTNRGTIHIGASPGGNTMVAGISHAPTNERFTNAAGGRIHIDRARVAIDAANYSTFDNAGTIIMGALVPVVQLIDGNQTGVVNNNPGGILEGTGNIPSEHLVNAGGTLSPGYQSNATPGKITVDTSAVFTNNILAIDVSGTGTPGVHHDQLAVNGHATIGGTLALSFHYTGSPGDQVTILSALSVTGTFSSVTGLPANWIVNYMPTAVVLSYGPLPYNTWTGAVNANWHTAGNWTGGIPDANDEVNIPDVSNDPVISAAGAVARSVTIQSGAMLTLTAAGRLALNGAVTEAMWNKGTVQNNGIIHIGNTGSTGNYGIVNSHLFYNNTGGQIHIDRVSRAAIYASENTFHNAGTITIGALAPVATLLTYQGTGTLSNNTGGIFKGTGGVSALRFVHAGGTLAPGISTGIVSVDKAEDFTNSTIAIEVNGKAIPGIDFDQVTVTENAALGGKLALTINYTGSAGDEITIIAGKTVTGRFSSVTGLPAGWGIHYLTNAVVLTYGQNYWTGNAGTNWHTAANWSLATVPTNAQRVIIADVTNDPVISTTGAVAQSISVLRGALLTVQAAGSLAINGSAAQSFENEGTVQNHGTISIGNISNIGVYGLQNEHLFYNNTGGTLTIDGTQGSQNMPLYNTSSGNFTNAGTVSIGSHSSGGQYALSNSGVFTNDAGGLINVDRASSTGIRNDNLFTNHGTIRIGAAAGGNTMSEGVSNSPTYNGFTNAAGGQLHIDRVMVALAATNYGTIKNNGTITVGALTPVPVLVNGNLEGVLINEAGGLIKSAGSFEAKHFLDAGGTLSPGAPTGIITVDNSEDFNKGILFLEVKGVDDPGVLADQVIVQGTAALGGTLQVSINYTPATGDEIVLLKAQNIVGTFSTITGLPANWYVNYSSTEVSLTYGQVAETAWTGQVNTDWNNAGNWTAGVPSGASLVTIADAANDPVVSTANARAKLVTVQAGALLTIANTGILSINSSTAQGFVNKGTVQNNGTLTIANVADAGNDAFRNEAVFNNNAQGKIHIDRAGTAGTSLNNATGSFTNAGTIRIGANAAAGAYGIANAATFLNPAGGQVHIDRVANIALQNKAGVWTNTGAITIGAHAVSGSYGIENRGTFNNSSGGMVKIDQSTHTALYNYIGGSLGNMGIITIGGQAAPGLYGVQSRGTFNNNAGGQINIDGTATSGMYNVDGVLTNAGNITIGAHAASGRDGFDNDGTVNNNAGGQIRIDRVTIVGIYHNGTGFVNRGALIIGGSESGNAITYGIRSDKNFTNEGGTINIDRVTYGITASTFSFDNTGAITIGALAPVPDLVSNIGAGILDNQTAGVIKGTGNIGSLRFNNAGGTLSPGYSAPGKITFNTNETFGNGILSMKVNGIAVAGTDFDQVVVNGTATLGGTLAVTMNYFPESGDQVTLLRATGITGTFSAVTGLPNWWQVKYTDTEVLLVCGPNAGGPDTWTGAFNTDWNDVRNWTAGVPGAATDVIIPNVPNDPVISIDAAKARTVTVEAGGLLTVVAAGVLSVNESTENALVNKGTVNNSGNVRIGMNANGGRYGIVNTGNFNNNTGAQIFLGRLQQAGIKNEAGTFTNKGHITIGTAGSTMTDGLQNHASFNNAGGQLNIDQTSQASIYNVAGTFTNGGTVIIGGQTSGGNKGVLNAATFLNGTGARLQIDRTTTLGIHNQGIAFTNQGTIRIGTSATTDMTWGIDNDGPFNNTGGEIVIDRTVTAAIRANTGTFHNAGSITAGGSFSNATPILSNEGTGTFSNNTNGSLRGPGSVDAARFVNAGGQLMPGISLGTMTFIGEEDFSNSTISVDVKGGVSGSDDQLIINGTATLGGTLNAIIDVSNPFVGQEVTLVSATAIAGTFTTVTGVAAGWHVKYTATSVVLAYGQSSGTTWTGAINTDWNNGGNWSAGVPDGTGSVTIPNVTNDPVISTATARARSVTIQSGGVLTVNATGTLTINSSPQAGLHNLGTVLNRGIITIGNTAAVGTFPLYNEGLFTNNAGGAINLHGKTSGSYVLYNAAGTFNNAGTITVGATAIAGTEGIANFATFNNLTGGQLLIDRVSAAGISNYGGPFTNAGTITIGAAAAPGKYGLQNASVFNNNAGGQINIDRATSVALYNLSGGAFTNKAILHIGATAAAGVDGINNSEAFHNAASGSITIDRVISAGIYQQGTSFTNEGTLAIGSMNGGNTIPYGIYCDKKLNNTGGQLTIDRVTNAITINADLFTNTGTITVGALSPVTNLIHSLGTGTLKNEAGGIINGTGLVDAARFANAGGTLSPGYAAPGKLTLNGAEDLSGGILSIEVRGTATAGTDHDQVLVQNGPVIAGGTLALSFDYTASTGDQVTILNASGGLTGTFSTVTGLPVHWKVTYTANAVVLVYDEVYEWTGAVSTAWNTSGNWVGGRVPGAGKKVLLPTTGVVRELTVNIGATVGAFEIEAGRTVAVNSPGVLNVTGQLINNGTIKGSGTIVNAAFTNTGTLSPGNSPGALNITGPFTNQGTILAEIGGTTAGTQYDQLVVSGPVTLGGHLDVSTINGFALQPGQTFTILTGSSVTGSFASVTLPAGVNGIITYLADAVTLSLGTSLPLTLLEFTGRTAGEEIMLTWKTAGEENTAAFFVERSTDGLHYQAIGTVAAAGSGSHTYSLTDGSPMAGNNYYRLQMKDVDGEFTYSKTVIVKMAARTGLWLAPVPATSYLYLTFRDPSLAGKPVWIFNAAGRLVTTVKLTASTIRLDLGGWTPGVYIVKMNNASYQFVKQ